MKALSFLLLLLSLSLGGWAWWEHSERVRAEDSLTAMTGERDRYKKSARETAANKASNLGANLRETGPTGLLEQLKKLDIVPGKEKQRSGLEPGEAGSLPKLPSIPSPGPGPSKFTRDPAMIQALRAQADAQLELLYGVLFKEMNLDDTRREKVLTILKDRQGARTELGLSVFDPELGAEERKAASSRLAVSASEAEVKLKEVLGADYGRLEQFELSMPEREEVAAFTAMLGDKNLPLEEEAAKKLADLLFAERQGFKFDRDLSDLGTVSPENLTEEVMDRYLEQRARLQDQVRPKVKELLSGEQYGVFLRAQEDQQRAAQSRLQLLRQSAGAGGDAEGRD